jgi:chromosome segregation ATPase
MRETTDSFYDQVPASDSPLRHAYTLDIAQLTESRDQWKARAEELEARLQQAEHERDEWAIQAADKLETLERALAVARDVLDAAVKALA